MIDYIGTEYPIPLANVDGKILAKVIEYCKHHVDAHKSSDDKPAVAQDEIKRWERDFVINNMEPNLATLNDLIGAADYLNIKSLPKMIYRTLYDMLLACMGPVRLKSLLRIR